MAWTANPPAPNEAGQTDSDRGKVSEFKSGNKDRQTGKVGSPAMVPNVVPTSEMEPEGKPAV